MVVKSDPLQCKVGEFTPREAVANWDLMSASAAIRFTRFLGRSMSGRLHRLGNHIFEVGEASLAECVYNHSRQF